MHQFSSHNLGMDRGVGLSPLSRPLTSPILHPCLPPPFLEWRALPARNIFLFFPSSLSPPQFSPSPSSIPFFLIPPLTSPLVPLISHLPVRHHQYMKQCGPNVWSGHWAFITQQNIIENLTLSNTMPEYNERGRVKVSDVQ